MNASPDVETAYSGQVSEVTLRIEEETQVERLLRLSNVCADVAMDLVTEGQARLSPEAMTEIADMLGRYAFAARYFEAQSLAQR